VQGEAPHVTLLVHSIPKRCPEIVKPLANLAAEMLEYLTGGLARLQVGLMGIVSR
jgi:hypothetical protein